MKQRRWLRHRIAVVIWIVYAVLFVLALHDAGVIPWAF